MKKTVSITYLLAGILLISLSSCFFKPKGTFIESNVPSPPDYAQTKYWSALPTMEDSADKTPGEGLENLQETADVDVFFLHPTIYNGTKKTHKNWNASFENEQLNEQVDNTTVQYQGSIFNAAGKIYAPRYRQAHIHAYYSKQREDALKAFHLAYEDVKNAFQYYLDHYNQGRPIIIASHSQGTTHAKMLVKEFFDGKPLQEQLVAAYLVGIEVDKDLFENIKVCETPTETGCFCTWRTYKTGHYPNDYEKNNNIAVTNPLTWTTEEMVASKELNKGAVLTNFEKIFPNVCNARVEDGILWVDKPKFPGSFFYITKNYHIGDYNLFYLNVRENAQVRVQAFKNLNVSNTIN